MTSRRASPSTPTGTRLSLRTAPEHGYGTRPVTAPGRHRSSIRVQLEQAALRVDAAGPGASPSGRTASSASDPDDTSRHWTMNTLTTEGADGAIGLTITPDGRSDLVMRSSSPPTARRLQPHQGHDEQAGRLDDDPDRDSTRSASPPSRATPPGTCTSPTAPTPTASTGSRTRQRQIGSSVGHRRDAAPPGGGPTRSCASTHRQGPHRLRASTDDPLPNGTEIFVGYAHQRLPGPFDRRRHGPYGSTRRSGSTPPAKPQDSGRRHRRR